jgi:predicted ATPase
MSATTPDFYVTGGTLPPGTPSYVPRQADRDLYAGLVQGEYCSVLTSRQMGKSSLMVQTAARLRQGGVAVAVLDLAALGQHLTIEQWYDGLLRRIGLPLDLEDDLEVFWQRSQRLSPLQRWMAALQEVVLVRCAGPVVLFIDELETVRSLPFAADEFFAALRECYNRRFEVPEFQRLNFCLLGVVTPTELIRDRRATPFDIGRRIELSDFSEAEAAVLAQGLGRPEPARTVLLQRVLYWTGGHPYLTQRLCQAVAADPTVADASGVDQLCDALYLSARARASDDNLLFVRRWLLHSDADRPTLLDLYAEIWSGRRVPFDADNPLIAVLRLSGIVGVTDGSLRVRNRIYERVFDREWLAPQMAPRAVFEHNLPVQLTSFIGRDREICEVKQLLDSARLVTLTGTGGCGKTRLALQVAARRRDACPAGVWLVDLAPVGDPELVPQTAANTLGLKEEPGRPIPATLAAHLHAKRLLLVLDNCEHLLPACASLVDTLLRSCPELRILATSREALRLAGERTYPVPSLSMPDLRHLPPTERLTDYEAVRLFAERAVFVQPSFALTDQNAPAVAQVCQRLDGIPLAIELAAARVKALSVEMLNERLDDMFRLLTGGSRTALPRQQTLRALIDWSYDLLSPSERALFRRLAVFAGGWTLAAAEAVCAGDEVEVWEVLDMLTSLVEKSLVLYEERGREGRYRLLETVRQYARDRLLEAREVEVARQHHRDWYLALAERAEPELRGAEQASWLERLEQELDNLRTALAWSQEQAGDPECGLRLAAALWWFWWVRGHWREGRQWLAELLALPGPAVPTLGRAHALLAAGTLSPHEEGDEQGVRLYQESLVMFRDLGDQRGAACSLHYLSMVAWDQQDTDRAAMLNEESLALFRETRDKRGIVWALFHGGWMARCARDYDRAEAVFAESLLLSREAGDKWCIATGLDQLAGLASRQGHYQQAAQLYRQGLLLYRELGDKDRVPRTLLLLGRMARCQARYERAAVMLAAAITLFRALGDEHTGWIAPCLEEFAGVWNGRGRPERAALSLGAAESLRDMNGFAMLDEERPEYETFVATLCSRLGEETFAAEWAEGREMTLQQTLELVLARW